MQCCPSQQVTCLHATLRTIQPNQILSVAFSDGGDQIYTGGIENVVNVWDLRREDVSMSLAGHSDSITGMRLSPDGNHLLTNSMDNTLRCVLALMGGGTWAGMWGGGVGWRVHVLLEQGLRQLCWRLQVMADQHAGSTSRQDPRPPSCFATPIRSCRVWDMRPYAPANRCTKVFAGHVHTFEKNLLRCDWSPDGAKVRGRLGVHGAGGPELPHEAAFPTLALLASRLLTMPRRRLTAELPARILTSSSQVSAGSGDRNVYIWDAHTRALMYKLPGHSGSVNEVVFHPKVRLVFLLFGLQRALARLVPLPAACRCLTPACLVFPSSVLQEPIVGSASSDKTIYLGELAV